MVGWGDRGAGGDQSPRYLQGVEHCIRVAQKTTSGNCNQAPITRAKNGAFGHGRTNSTDDARGENGAAPNAVANALGDVQHKANDAQPSNIVPKPEGGASASRNCVSGVGATPPGSGFPACRIEIAAALGTQPGRSWYTG